MLIRFQLVVVSLFGAAMAAVALAGPPIKITDLATADDLEIEARDRLKELESLLNETSEFADHQKRIEQVASLLAVVAQALAEQESDSPLKAYAPDLRDAAQKMAAASSAADAQAGLQAAQAALDRQSPKTAAAEADWARLVLQRPIMEEMEVRMQQLQRALRRPKDKAAESRHATSVALASVTTLADTHAAKDKAQIADWERLSRQIIEQMKTVSAAIQQSQPKEAQVAFKAARATCVECHRQFNAQN
jgi:hypothetical protein